MKLFELIIYQSCNYKCEDCPMEQWTYEPDELDENGKRRNDIDYKLLLKWIDKYLNPKEWFIEITGGEPGMYNDIFNLIYELSDRKYQGIIRTNGSLPLPVNSRFKRVAAWHKQAKEFPKYGDYIVILENPKDNWEEKKQYCDDHNIGSVVFPYIFFSTDCSQTTKYPPKQNGYFDKVTTMFSSGAIGGCPKSNETENISLQNMSPPIIADLCGICGNVEALEYFIDNAPGFKEIFEVTDVLPKSNYIIYPLLNQNSEWVDKEGNIVGLLGDDISLIPIEKIDVIV